MIKKEWGELAGWDYAGCAIAYGMVYTAVLLLAAAPIFGQRDFA